jgi:hypothetical protein
MTACAREPFGRCLPQPFRKAPPFGQASVMASESGGPAAQRPVTVPVYEAAATAYRPTADGGTKWSAGAAR